MRFTTFSAGLTAAALLVAGTATIGASAATANTGTSTAHGDETSLSARVTVTDHVVATKTTKKVRIDVYYTRHGGTSMKVDGSNYVQVQSRSGYYWEFVKLTRDSASHEHAYVPVRADDPVGTYDVGLSSSAEVKYWDTAFGDGFWDTDFDAIDDDYIAHFAVKRNSAITVNASPEPVKKNHYVTVKGNLKRLWTNGYDMSYKNASKQRVNIYFDPTGKSPKKYVTHTTTNSKGVFSKKIKQKVSGTWSVVYVGTGTYASDSASDAVKVRH